MKLKAVWTCCLVAAGFLCGGGKVSAQTRYDILRATYASQGNTTLGTLSDAGWESLRVTDDKYWTAFPTPTAGNPTPVTIWGEVKFSSGNYAIGIENPAGTLYQSVGAVTGTSVLNPATLANPSGTINNSDVKIYDTTGGVYTTPESGGPPAGSVGFEVALGSSLDPWAWTITNIGSVTAGVTPVATHADLTSSTDTPDSMIAYRYVAPNGVEHYILMWDGGDAAGDNYSSLVLDVTGVQNPEPTSMALMGLGSLGLIGYRLRRRLTAKSEATAS